MPVQPAYHSKAIANGSTVARMARFPSLPQHRDCRRHPRHLTGLAKKPPFSATAYRQITRPLIRADGSFDRKKIFADARFRFHEARRYGERLDWSGALEAAWAHAHRQIALARAFDAAPPRAAAPCPSLPLAA